MSEDRMNNVPGGSGELNLRLSAEDLSEFGPDIQNVLRRLAGSQQEQQQRHPTASSSSLGLPARIPPGHGYHLTQRPVCFDPPAALPSYNTQHRTLPSSWQQQAAAEQRIGTGLDDFGQFGTPVFEVLKLAEEFGTAY